MKNTKTARKALQLKLVEKIKVAFTPASKTAVQKISKRTQTAAKKLAKQLTAELEKISHKEAKLQRKEEKRQAKEAKVQSNTQPKGSKVKSSTKPIRTPEKKQLSTGVEKDSKDNVIPSATERKATQVAEKEVI